MPKVVDVAQKWLVVRNDRDGRAALDLLALSEDSRAGDELASAIAVGVPYPDLALRRAHGGVVRRGAVSFWPEHRGRAGALLVLLEAELLLVGQRTHIRSTLRGHPSYEYVCVCVGGGFETGEHRLDLLMLVVDDLV